MNTVARYALPAAGVLVAATVLAACGSSGGTSAGADSSAMGSMSSMPADSGQMSMPTGTVSTASTVPVKLTEFHIALGRTTLTPGTYTFDVTNAGSITHALTVDGQGVEDKSTGDLSAGEHKTLTVTLARGSYEFYCPVGDHKMEGMDEKVQVG